MVGFSGQRNDLTGQFESQGGTQLNGAVIETGGGHVYFGHVDPGTSPNLI
jgi:hypothetical protein